MKRQPYHALMPFKAGAKLHEVLVCGEHPSMNWPGTHYLPYVTCISCKARLKRYPQLANQILALKAEPPGMAGRRRKA